MAGRVLASGASVLADIGYQPEWTTVMGSSFMRHALIAGTLVALVAGPIGYFVVVRRDSFAAHALAHIGFPGATAAALCERIREHGHPGAQHVPRRADVAAVLTGHFDAAKMKAAADAHMRARSGSRSRPRVWSPAAAGDAPPRRSRVPSSP